MSKRTYLGGGLCDGCRYWSDRITADSGREAVCLNPEAQAHAKLCAADHTCSGYMIGNLGAIDAPTGDPYRERVA